MHAYVIMLAYTSGMFHSGLRIMALLKYFKCSESTKEKRIQSVLPKPDCPFSHLMPNLAIETANSYCCIQNKMKLSRWVSVHTCIDLKLYGKA